MFERFTDRARKIMALANQEAIRYRHDYIDTPHILMAMAKEGRGDGANVLQHLGVDLHDLQQALKEMIATVASGSPSGKLPQTNSAKQVIMGAIEEAKELKHGYVGSGHMLLGLLRDPGTIAGQVLQRCHVELNAARVEVAKLIHGRDE